MAYQHHPHGQPALSATFVPGGYDDYYMPTPGPELVSPAPQRHMPDMPDQIQENLASLELEASGPRTSISQYHQPLPPQPFPQTQPGQAPPPATPQSASSDYSLLMAYSTDLPHFSPFPRLNNPPPNVPPSDDEKEAILENARAPVLNSNDPEMQLAWAQDALAYVAAAQTHEDRLAENRPKRAATPAVEHQLRVDAMSVVSFLADQHHPKAEFMKGMWLEFGNFGWRQDKREAFRCYARAAEKGFSRAEYRMGMQFEQNGDPVKALIHYKRGADAGDAASNYRFGMMTLMGQLGQQQDFARGIQMLRIAAEHADENAPQGAFVLGMLQARELPQVTVPEVLLPYNEAEARMNIEKAAYLGFAKAQLKMGAAYELCSLGCEFDPALSLHYNALAARQGEGEAEMAISKWFLCGSDGIFSKNEELAYEYALRAARSGLPTAEFALGYFYEIGMHVPVNLEKATEWYEKAARNGNQDAIGRIESLKKSAVLSKKDHENVAINKIKSQYGSMRGKRPDRLRAQAPALPSVSDDQEDVPPPSGRATVPPRTSSTTPYPMNDGPPVISTPQNQTRPASVAPYPMDNGPPKLGGRPPLAGGFAPELRSSSAAPAQGRQNSGSAFNINPDIYNQRPGPDNYGRAPIQANMPPRSATTLSDVGPGSRPYNQRIGPGEPRPSYGRTNSAGPSPSGGPPNQSLPPVPQKLDIGFAAPGGPSPKHSPNNRPQASVPDIGYVAPLHPKRTSPVAGDPNAGATNRPPRGESRTPSSGSASGYPPQQGRPGSSPQQPQQPYGRPPRVDSAPTAAALPQISSKPNLPRPATQNGPKPAKQPSHPSMAPANAPKPGKGPKTFDEMGVPAAKDSGDCVIM